MHACFIYNLPIFVIYNIVFNVLSDNKNCCYKLLKKVIFKPSSQSMEMTLHTNNIIDFMLVAYWLLPIISL